MEFYIQLSDGTLYDTTDYTVTLEHIPNLNLEGGTYGFYVNLRKALEKVTLSQDKLNIVGDQITRYKMAMAERSTFGRPHPTTVNQIIGIRLEHLHEVMDTLLSSDYQLSIFEWIATVNT